jgi:hypothetical protein
LNAGNAGPAIVLLPTLEEITKLVEQPVHPVIRLRRVVLHDHQHRALLIREGVDDPGHLDQVRPMMAG